MDETTEILFNKLVYSCAFEKYKGHELYIDEHFLGFQISGETHVIHAEGNTVVSENTVVLARKNQLMKTTKYPSPDGRYQFLSIILDQEALQQYALENKIDVDKRYTGEQTHFFEPNNFLKNYFHSLIPYVNKTKGSTQKLADLKIREAIELLLQYNREFTYLLFDFAEPHKIDLEEFMQKNYMFNVPIKRFAKLTGRSLSAFKRDFKKRFNTSPRKWLQNKRLNEAYSLIKHKQKEPVNIYLDLGFENLSHFYFSFKQKFGITTSEVLK